MADAASRLANLAEELLGGPLPVRLRTWDGGEAGPADAPVLVLRDRRALRRMIWKPGELGLVRAWVAGELDVEGDLYEVLDRVSGLLWERDGDSPGPLAAARDPRLRAAARELL
ncbi:SAM-dependent methyltransferase, partial [Streptomyces cinereoruber]